MVSAVDNNNSSAVEASGKPQQQQQQQNVGSAAVKTAPPVENEQQNNSGSNGSMSQSIGREFARQYYTMLANAPKYMHRFYGTKSVFVRNEEVVTGQTDIETHIAALNLKDCHTKILMVDARDTIDRGVVVQIIGEISINNGPWKNFVQTFVLASQTEKKYYVHNDTFYYLDEILSDKQHSSNSKNNVVEQADHANDKVDKTAVITETQNNNVINGTLNNVGDEPCSDVTKKADGSSYAIHPQAVNQRADVDLTNTTANVNMQQELTISMTVDGGSGTWVQQAIPTSQVEYHGQQHIPHAHQQVSMANESVGDVQYGNVVSVCQVGGCKEGVAVTVEEYDESMPNDVAKQSSWASIAASGKFPPHPQQLIPFHVQPQRSMAIGQIAVPVVSGLVSFTTDNSKLTSIPPNAAGGLKSPDAVREMAQAVAVSSNSNVAYHHPGVARGPQGPYQRYKPHMDQQQTCEMQVYVRSLPENTKEEELREVFAKFGNITKVSIVNRHPYPFAFVTFDNPESVKRVFENNQPAPFIRGNHRLIVEKKRSDTENGAHGRYGPQQRYGDRDGMAGNRMGNFRNGSGISNRGGSAASGGGPFRGGGQVRGGGRPGANFYNTNRTAYITATNQPFAAGPMPPPMIK